MNRNVFKKAMEFVYRNARPIDLALWRYHFEGGKRSDVIEILSFYQNADGGFGHAIEPDFWNSNSTPIATWKAISILNEVGVDLNEKIVKNILNYFDSGKDFENGLWYNTVRSNNDYPHAVWWECGKGEGTPIVNPTISLAGFALKYADTNSALHKRAVDIVTAYGNNFIKEPICDMHITPLYMELYEYCASIKGFDLFDLAAYKSALYSAVKSTVCTDTEKWCTEYVCKPSTFYNSSRMVLDILDRKLCEKKCEQLLNSQLDDGSYNIPWIWHNDYTEYYIAANWWKSSFLLKNMLYLKDFKLI
ncbi:MAG: hypothetical protein J1F71_04820 [Clostridiales bacterium]|nr:hypothetical protein [Clostridiales bacterium]